MAFLGSESEEVTLADLRLHAQFLAALHGLAWDDGDQLHTWHSKEAQRRIDKRREDIIRQDLGLGPDWFRTEPPSLLRPPRPEREGRTEPAPALRLQRRPSRPAIEAQATGVPRQQAFVPPPLTSSAAAAGMAAAGSAASGFEVPSGECDRDYLLSNRRPASAWRCTVLRTRLAEIRAYTHFGVNKAGRNKSKGGAV